MRCKLLVLVTAAILPVAGAQAQNAVNIGLASAAKNEVIVVGDAGRGLKVGDTIFQNQHIRTGRNSAAQLLFRDETALTMGPSASLVLDKAVYDPDKHTSEITVRAVSGAFRFVTGSSPSGNYSINTPAGTVGIRGTWIDMLIAGQSVRIMVRRGRVQFCNLAGQCARVLPGFELRATHNRIGVPTKVSHETVESIVALWFKDSSEANVGELAPGAGPGEDSSASGVGKSFWWLDGIFRDRDQQFNRGSVTGLTTPQDGATPPGSGPPGAGPPPGASPPGPPPPSLGTLKLPTGSPFPGAGTPSGLVNNPGAAQANKSLNPPGPPSGPPGQLKK